jgi:hypothetical protein
MMRFWWRALVPGTEVMVWWWAAVIAGKVAACIQCGNPGWLLVIPLDATVLALNFASWRFQRRRAGGRP